MPSKQIRLGIRSYIVAGHSEDDPYFVTVADGFENGLFRFLVKNFRRDSVAIDVGANIGITSMILAQVFDQGEIVAFEPGIRNFELLQMNLDANRITNVKAVNAALSNSVGEVSFVENSAYGGIVGGYRQGGGGVYDVEQSTIDAFVAATGLTKVDLIKIDVEGQEGSVLAGAVDTIKRHNPAIYLEFNAWTLLVYGSQNPREFIEDLIATFDSVSVVDPATGELSQVDDSNVFGFLHTHLTTNGCINDLLLISDEGRIRSVETMKPGLAEFVLESAETAFAERDQASAERDQASAERDQASAERDQASAERDQALAERDRALQQRDEAEAERDLLLASSSWRITAPLRRLSRAVRRQ